MGTGLAASAAHPRPNNIWVPPPPPPPGRPSRFLSSVWREFTRIRWIGGDNALIVQTSRNFPDDRIVDQWKVVSQSPASIEGRIFRVYMHSISYSSFKPLGLLVQNWNVFILRQSWGSDSNESRNCPPVKRIIQKYSKSSWPDLVWLYHICITWMNQNLHQWTEDNNSNTMHIIHKRTGRVSFGGWGWSLLPKYFSIACTNIKLFYRNITWFFALIWLFEPPSPMGRTPMIITCNDGNVSQNMTDNNLQVMSYVRLRARRSGHGWWICHYAEASILGGGGGGGANISFCPPPPIILTTWKIHM